VFSFPLEAQIHVTVCLTPFLTDLAVFYSENPKR
jgi:hypothetical protein